MADSEAAPVFDPTAKKKKSRKSVAFNEEDASDALNGGATETGGDKSSAESHSVDSGSVPAAEEDLFKGMKKKKKSSKDKEAKEGDEAAGGDGEFDLTAKKKKKKKLPAVDSFDAKLAEAGIAPAEGEDAEGTATASTEPVNPADAGDPIAGTGVWASNSDAPVTYPLLLSRFFTLLRAQHPDLAADGRLKAYKIPPPQVLREGNRKSIFANISEICKKMKRQDDHVMQFLFAELGTSGSVDGSKRLVIKGRFQQKQLENVLRRYILEYVTCRTCKSPDTELKKGENRLYFVTCNSCGSRRSVTAIKTGFQATVGKRRRAQA